MGFDTGSSRAKAETATSTVQIQFTESRSVIYLLNNSVYQKQLSAMQSSLNSSSKYLSVRAQLCMPRLAFTVSTPKWLGTVASALSPMQTLATTSKQVPLQSAGPTLCRLWRSLRWNLWAKWHQLLVPSIGHCPSCGHGATT